MKFKTFLLVISSLLICFYTNSIITANQQYKTDVVMFGDSITARGEWSELFPGINIINLGVDGDTAYNLKKRIRQVYSYNPEYCIILVGFNDICLSRDSVDFIYKNYTWVLNKLIQRDITPVIVSTTYAADVLKNYEKVNTEIDALNQMLKKYASDNNVRYIDLNSRITKNHRLSGEYATDQVHLNDKAYKIWKDEISGIIKQ